LCPLGTAATNRPIVPAPGDYGDGEIGGMMIARENRGTRRKPAPVPLCPPQIPHAFPDGNPGSCGRKPATNRLSYGTACLLEYVSLFVFSPLRRNAYSFCVDVCVLATMCCADCQIPPIMIHNKIQTVNFNIVTSWYSYYYFLFLFLLTR
jgi:hypothetical protein